MAAYGALVSLSQTLDTILHSDGIPVSLNRRQLESLHEKVSFLQEFLENPLRKTSNQEAADILEIKIRDAAFKAEDLIETHVFNAPKNWTEEIGTAVSPLWLYALHNVSVFLIIQFLCHFVVKKFLHVEVQDTIYLLVQILVAIGIVVRLSQYVFLRYNLDSENESRNRRYVLQRHNLDQENKGLVQVVKGFGFIVNEVNKINAAKDVRPTKDILHAGSSAGGYFEVTGKNVVVGLDSDLQEITAHLTGDSDSTEVVSIVGMGGIGKTTLARQVYDDNYVGHHFDLRTWVTVSQQYSLTQVLRSLLDSAKMLPENMYEEAEQQSATDLHKCKDKEEEQSPATDLYRCLKDRRYLVVLDDIWDTELWDAVSISFPDDSNGSRVLLTTRWSKVALYANSCCLHEMHLLNPNESWNLLCSKVFGDKKCPRELKKTGKKIAKKCEGLPLAIAVIGGLLSKVSRTEEYWKSIAGNLNSIVTKDDDQCMKILSLSYNKLPHHLRPCFLYMGAFPEDYEIPVSKLIRLWAAEGFLKPHRSKSVEVLAEEYLIDLVERNLVFVCKKSANGKIKTCNIHDLLRNVCIQKACKEEFLYVVKLDDDIFQEGMDSSRRLSIHPSVGRTNPEILYESMIHNSRAHSLLCPNACHIYPSRVCLDHKLLRVLDLIIVSFFHFPNEIVTLVSLRYLAFTYNEALPSSISQLQNLETLVYYSRKRGHCPFLPLEIWTMPKLRHLCLTPSFFPVPLNAQSLANTSFILGNLQTLSELRNFKFSEDILEKVPFLKTLEVSYDVSPSLVWSSYQLEDLVNLCELETLKILIKNSDHRSEIVNPPKLAFPHSLKRLTLSGCSIPWKYMTVIGALRNLEVLKLRNNACRGSDWEPIEKEFCRLKYLLLEDLDLAKWSADEMHFPHLECLIIRSCYQLKEIPSGIGKIPSLAMIKLVDCLSSAVTSAKEIEGEQQSLGNVDPKVHVDSERVFKDKFDFFLSDGERGFEDKFDSRVLL